MTDLSDRSSEPELMDQPETSEADYAAALADLARVNRVTFAHRPVLRWLDAATAHWPTGVAISIMDVASGQGDLLRAIHRWGTARGFVLDLRGLDLNPRSAVQSRAATPAGQTIVWLTGDVFEHIPTPPADFIVTSQFAHHLDDAAVVRLLRWLDQHARRGWLISDLHRHSLAWYGFPILARLMRWQRLVRTDGTISIARSFRPAEWRALVAEAGVIAGIRWHLPFRLCVSSRT
jgi:2-polyprenyl-3-methyl-5-hydroxy-6-metoxy-1,4-benzoquinol methylase